MWEKTSRKDAETQNETKNKETKQITPWRLSGLARKIHHAKTQRRKEKSFKKTINY